MFIEEHLDLFFVDIAHLGSGHDDLVTILVRTRLGDLINILEGGAAMVEDSKLVKVIR